MPKGYWIVAVEVHDRQTYDAYRAAIAEPLERHGARFLVRGGRSEQREGEGLPRQVVIEFPNFEAAVACYDSADYQAARALREAASHASFVIAEGWEG